MLLDNPLLAQLKQQLHSQTPRIEGVVRANEKGFGFLDTDKKKSYFIPTHKMKNVIHGDRVSGIIVTNNDKESFEPEEIIEPALTSFLGCIDFENKSMVIKPDNTASKLSIRCKVSPDIKTRLKAGDWVKAKLISHPLETDRKSFFAEITQFVAESTSPYLLWLTTLAKYDLESSTPQVELEQFVIQDDENLLREDLTAIDFFTIDSQETQDMDDALFIEKTAQGHFKLSVAIADPTAYILPNSELDVLAKQRIFSTYLPNYSVPMLPKSLSHNLCSLKANEKRPAMVCKITIDETGQIIEPSEFTAAWIESKAKLSYQNVADYLENIAPLDDPLPKLAQQLDTLSEFTQQRIEWRKQNALLFKDNAEYRFIFNENRQLIDVTQEFRRISHRMVEEAMIAANLAFTQKMKTELGFGIFNIHCGFDVKHLDLVVKILNESGLTGFDKTTITDLAHYKTIFQQLDNPFIEYRLRRLQSSADFSIQPLPHFSLGFDAYATWTSPIRKFGDMINHRLIKTILCTKQAQPPKEDILQSMNERRKLLRFAERDVAEKLYAQYLANKVDHDYTAEIVDINRGGARVRLTEIGAFAFMPLSLIHPVKNEIQALPEEGKLVIKKPISDEQNEQEVTIKLTDKVSVKINEVKQDNQSIIVRYA